MKRAGILGLVLIAVTSTAFAGPRFEPTAVYPTSIVGPSTVVYPDTPHRQSFVVEVEYVDHESCEMASDGLTLRVLTNEWVAKPLAEKMFCSAYGKFELTLVDVTGDGIEGFVLVTGEGHGTSVMEQTLVVWTREKSSFESLLSVTFSGYFGGGRRWWYRPECTDVNRDGQIDLRLSLEHGPLGESSIENPCLIPEVVLKEFVFDPQKSNLITHRSVKGKPIKDCTGGAKE